MKVKPKVKARPKQQPTPKQQPKPDPEIVFKLTAKSDRLVCTRLPFATFPYELLPEITELVEEEVNKLVKRGPRS